MKDSLVYILFFSLIILIIMTSIKIYYLRNGSEKDKIFYFDNNSTTLIYDKDIKDEIMEWISCGNPSNILHVAGIAAHNKIKEAREQISQELKIDPSELYFTSGATESNNIIIQGFIKEYIQKHPTEKFCVLTSAFEHPSVLAVIKNLASINTQLVPIFVNPVWDTKNKYYGTISAEDIEEAIKKAPHKVIFMSIMHANNETGAVQNLSEIGKIAKKYDIFFHCDATQSLGKYVLHPKEHGINAMSFSGHKFHGPKGIGGLYINDHKNSTTSKICNLCYGGDQEFTKRPGTENVSNIAGLAKALQKAHTNRDEKNKRLQTLKKWIIHNIGKYERVFIVGPIDDTLCLPNTILIGFPDLVTCNKDFVEILNQRKICVSVGSACKTGKTSHVLEAMKIDDKYKNKIIRISLSDYTTKDECEYLVENIIGILKRLKK